MRAGTGARPYISWWTACLVVIAELRAQEPPASYAGITRLVGAGRCARPHILWLAACLVLTAGMRAQEPPASYAGSETCQGCHSEIYQSYFTTPMGRSSGEVGDGSFPAPFRPSSFLHSSSGIRYRVYGDQTASHVEFANTRSTHDRPAFRGSKRFEYYIGSGAAARGYIFSADGYWFQSPVSYYSRRQVWDVAPGYEKDKRLDVARPVDRQCLECHASRVQHIEGTQNKYRGAPFLEGAIGCERCHGHAAAHVNRMSAGAAAGSKEIVNPARLEPVRRDSVCARCHLTGEINVARLGRSASSFRPADVLSDHTVAFVWSPPKDDSIKVIGHFEKLWQSRCKQVSGDRLWCGTCHDPHAVPPAAKRAEHFRTRCLSCHGAKLTSEHAKLADSQGNDCTACHMPKTRARDGGHSAFTDHSMPRTRHRQPRPANEPRELVSFWAGTGADRERGLAYARLALRDQERSYAMRAFQLLEKAQAGEAEDPQVSLQLAFLHDRRGDEAKAIELYKRAASLDPSLLTATVNLGGKLALQGRYQEASKLWEDALSRNAGLEAARINLALAHRKLGNEAAAREELLKVLAFNPDSHTARMLLTNAE